MNDNQFTFPETSDNTADKPSSNINNIEASAEADFKELLEEAPALTLEPFAKEEVQPLETQTLAEKKPEAAVIDDPELTEEEKKMVMDFASQIDIENSQAVLQYGAGSQKKIADFSESALSRVRTKDLGEVGQILSSVVTELRSLEEGEEEKGLFGIFKKTGNKIANLKVKYDKAEVNINKISKVLEEHQITLLKDIAMLDKMYELNLKYFKELSMYILAGKERLRRATQEELPQLLEKAQKSGLPEDSSKARDFSELCARFERKIHDLELTRAISLQMAPQIRLIQNNDSMMSDKIQSTIMNTIPLWKNESVFWEFAYKSAPQSVIATGNYMQTLMVQDRWTEANDILEKLVKRPGVKLTLAMLTNWMTIRAKMGDYDDAIKVFNMFNPAEAGNTNAVDIATFYCARGVLEGWENHWEQAEFYMRKGLEISNMNIKCNISYIDALYKTGKMDQSKKYLESFLQDMPADTVKQIRENSSLAW